MIVNRIFTAIYGSSKVLIEYEYLEYLDADNSLARPQGMLDASNNTVGGNHA